MKKIISIISTFIGVIVIILGVNMTGTPADHEMYRSSLAYFATDYDARSAAFGADFYTYVYDGIDTIVDELNDINKSVETIVKAENSLIASVDANIKAVDSANNNTVKACSMIVISIGLGIFVFGLNSIANAFTREETY